MLTCKYCGKEIVEAVDAPSGYAHMNNYDYKMCCNFANVDEPVTPAPNPLDAIEIQYRCAAISGMLANPKNKLNDDELLNNAYVIAALSISKWHRS